jgi:hypothetical protein
MPQRERLGPKAPTKVRADASQHDHCLLNDHPRRRFAFMGSLEVSFNPTKPARLEISYHLSMWLKP